MSKEAKVFRMQLGDFQHVLLDPTISAIFKEEVIRKLERNDSSLENIIK